MTTASDAKSRVSTGCVVPTVRGGQTAVVDVFGALVVAYLLGTIPSAVVASRLASGGQVDIRQAGSGNPGALNTLGVHGAKWGAVVLLMDSGKAVLACVLALQV